MHSKIRVLLVSTLYPSCARPVHGIFVETRLKELIKSGEIEAKVIAPVPWFPFKSSRFGEYAKFAATPNVEIRDGIQIYHPRYFLPPAIGMNIAPHTLARSILATARQIQRDGFDFDLIDAHYYYPDGVAAGLVAKKLDKPFVVTARGTDLNLIPQYRRPRQLILETAERASASIGVCRALMDQLHTMGAGSEKLHVMRNGVDLERFAPIDRDDARRHLGLQGNRILLSVGHLIERKGHHIAIEALSRLSPQYSLVIAGAGPELPNLQKLAENLGITQRVSFVGQIPNDSLKWWYSAADALVLCSSREGWANVLLESMACGTPVVATNIWGTPEVVNTPDAGQLMDGRSANALIAAIEKLFAAIPDRNAVRRHACQFGWAETTNAQLELFKAIAHA